MLGCRKTDDRGVVAAAMAAPARAEPASPETGPKLLDRLRTKFREFL